MSLFLTLTGAVFLIYAVILCIISNYNLGIFLNIILGGCILFSGIFFDEIVFFCSAGAGIEGERLTLTLRMRLDKRIAGFCNTK